METMYCRQANELFLTLGVILAAIFNVQINHIYMYSGRRQVEICMKFWNLTHAITTVDFRHEVNCSEHILAILAGTVDMQMSQICIFSGRTQAEICMKI